MGEVILEGSRFIILFSGRSGGTLIQRSLDNHPMIKCYGEPVQELPFGRQLMVMETLLNQFDDQVGACGFKTKLFEFRSRNEVRLAQYIQQRGIKVIHLYRENVIKHALSHYIGEILYERRQAWEIYDENDRVTPVDVDVERFRGQLHYIQEWERRNFIFAQACDKVMTVSYEDLAADKDGILGDIQEWLGVEVRDDLVEPMKKVTPDDLGEAVSNYRQFSRWVCGISPLGGCKERPYFRFLDRQRQVLDWMMEDEPDEVNFVVEAAWQAWNEGDREAAETHRHKAQLMAPDHPLVLGLKEFWPGRSRKVEIRNKMAPVSGGSLAGA